MNSKNPNNREQRQDADMMKLRGETHELPSSWGEKERNLLQDETRFVRQDARERFEARTDQKVVPLPAAPEKNTTAHTGTMGIAKEILYRVHDIGSFHKAIIQTENMINDDESPHWLTEENNTVHRQIAREAAEEDERQQRAA